MRLTRIFRQAQGSRIIMNAHRINKGEAIDMRGGKNSDFFLCGKADKRRNCATLVQYCKENPRYYHVDPIQDIQVLTPMQRGEWRSQSKPDTSGSHESYRYLPAPGGTQYRLNDKSNADQKRL